MPERIAAPSVVESAGTLPKRIEEYVGRVNTGEGALSIAHMRSPQGWEEPAQTPEFDEWTLVLAGLLVVEHEAGRPGGRCRRGGARETGGVGALQHARARRRRVRRGLPAGLRPRDRAPGGVGAGPGQLVSPASCSGRRAQAKLERTSLRTAAA